MRRLSTGVGGVLVAAMAVAVVAASHASRPDGSPIDPPGTWRVVWIAAVVIAFVSYAIGSLVARRGPYAAAIVVAVVVQVLPLFGPLLLSRDVYLYWAEARVVTVYHADPYRISPSTYPGDPGTLAASAQWRTKTEPYGPGWVALSAVTATVAGRDGSTAALVYRALSTLGVVLAIAVLARRTRDPRAVAFFGWSPLIALHYAGGGHSDAWIALALVIAVAFRGTALGGLAWPLGASIKGVPAIALPLELARRRLRFSTAFWAALVGAGIVVVATSTALFGTSWITAAAIGAHGASPIGGVHFLHEAGLRHRYAVVVGGLVFVAVYLWLLREAWIRGRARMSIALTALCMCTSLLRPWYAIWPVALGAVEADGLGQALAFSLSAYVFFADATP